MTTFADLINPEATAQLQKIIDDRKAREKAEWEEWMRREEEHVKKTHFKTAEDMINWVMSGGRIVNGRDEMKLSEDGKRIMVSIQMNTMLVFGISGQRRQSRSGKRGFIKFHSQNFLISAIFQFGKDGMKMVEF